MINYSFIIPHHNSPDLLQRLIKSIPIREDIEIIVVDDNSDEDKKIDNIDFKRKDVRSITIDREHTKGAGRARNVGLEIARGKWILFADADDFYAPNFLVVLDRYKDDDIEILFFTGETVDSNTLKPGHDRTYLDNVVTLGYDGSKESIDRVLYTRWGPWRKMILSEYIRKYNFRFEEIPNGNDVLFSLLTSYFSKKWKVVKKKLYVVTYSNDSITYRPITKPKYITTINNISKRAEFFKFIGHKEWAKFWGGPFSQSVLRYIVGITKENPILGIEVFFYYIKHYFSIKYNSSKFINIIVNIQSEIDLKNILKINKVI